MSRPPRRRCANGPASSIVAVVGFCFGGAQAFLLSARDDVGLDAVIGFYGRIVTPADHPMAGAVPTVLDFVPDMKLPILGLFGGDDPGIPPDTVEAFDEALDADGPSTRSSYTPARRTRSSTASTTSTQTRAPTPGAASLTSWNASARARPSDLG